MRQHTCFGGDLRFLELACGKGGSKTVSHNNNQRNASKKAELTFVPALEEPLDLCEGQATNAAEQGK